MKPTIPLLLLPGLSTDERLWRDTAHALADIAHVTVADLTQDDDVSAMAARVLAAAPPRFALAALSMGGHVAFEILRQAPERVMKLALFDTSARPETPAGAAKRRQAMASARHGHFIGMSPRVLRELLHPSRLESPLAQEVVSMAERVGREAFLRQQSAVLNRPDSRPLLPQISVPTLIAVGDADRRTPPEHAEEMHHAIAGSMLHVFEGCGHLPPLELPEETAAVMRRWLEAV